ncbi:hypothetical protein M0802_012314 [Mischocyttarus mexicanus]|nr:hypothetical protein M0802_012314 [Mischocyttarus mexicanus]
MVMPGITYANMAFIANSRIPIRQNSQPMELVDSGITKPTYPPKDNNFDNESRNCNSLEKILSNFKNSIIKKYKS